MNERRRFLRVLGGGALAVGCGGSASEPNGVAGAGGGSAASSSGMIAASSASSSTTGAGGAPPGTGGAGGAMCGGGGAQSEGQNDDECSSDRGVFDMGKPSDYAADGLYKAQNLASNVLIGRDSGGLYAISSLCTHKCCDLNTSENGFAIGTFTTLDGQKVIQCNCHGSMYSYTGVPVRGPAVIPLQAYQLDLGCDGVLYADTTKPVASTQRLRA